MKKARVSLAVAVALAAICSLLATSAKVTSTFGTASATTRPDGVRVEVDIATGFELPGADPFDVQVVCIDASGLFKWLLTVNAQGAAVLNLMGHSRSASFYGVDVEVEAGLSLELALPPPLVYPDDRLLISIRDDAITASGPIFSLPIDVYRGEPLRMDTLRAALAASPEGALLVMTTNLTHVPLVVPLAHLVLGLAPTPDWIPETTPDIRWTPNPPLAEMVLALNAGETITVMLPMPAIPAASAAAYKSAMDTLYAGMVDAYPGDYLAVGFPAAWGISWSYLPVVLP